MSLVSVKQQINKYVQQSRLASRPLSKLPLTSAWIPLLFSVTVSVLFRLEDDCDQENFLSKNKKSKV